MSGGHDWADAVAMPDAAPHMRDLPPTVADTPMPEAMHNYIARRLAEHDPVSAPPHYRHGAVECIDALEAALGREGFAAYCRGAAIKYLWRGPHKGAEAEDYRKAAWYVARLLRTLEAGR